MNRLVSLQPYVNDNCLKHYLVVWPCSSTGRANEVHLCKVCPWVLQNSSEVGQFLHSGQFYPTLLESLEKEK